jgi:hypothetical protein
MSRCQGPEASAFVSLSHRHAYIDISGVGSDPSRSVGANTLSTKSTDQRQNLRDLREDLVAERTRIINQLVTITAAA